MAQWRLYSLVTRKVALTKAQVTSRSLQCNGEMVGNLEGKEGGEGGERMSLLTELPTLGELIFGHSLQHCGVLRRGGGGGCKMFALRGLV